MTPRRAPPTRILALLPLLGLGCGLITINGKPLLAGKKASPPGSDAPAASPAEPAGSSSLAEADASTDPGTGATSPTAPANAGPSDRQRLKQAIDSGNEANRALFEAAKNDEVPPDLLAQLSAAEDTARELGDAGSAQFYAIRRYSYQYLAGLRSADEGDTGPITELMGGELVGKGVADSKSMKIDVAVKKDHCYVVAMRWRQPTGNEELRDVRWTAKSSGTIQRFRQSYTHPRIPWSWGVCATADTTTTFSAEPRASGTKPRLQYVVMRWKRSEMPLEQTLHASVVLTDPCSSPAWKSLWTNPIPGSILYLEDEPVLISRITPGEKQIVMEEADAGQRGGSTTRLRDEPSGSPRFSPYRMPKCYGSKYAESALSLKAAKCHEAIDRKYDARFDAVDQQRANARTLGAAEQAEHKRSQLIKAEGQERRSKCGAVDEKLEAEVQRTFDEIVDHYTDGHAPPPNGRAAWLNPK